MDETYSYECEEGNQQRFFKKKAHHSKRAADLYQTN
jgi:hypothetical protein